MGGAYSTHGEDECNVLVGNPEGKRQLGKPRRRWEDIIRTDLIDLVCEGADLIRMVQDCDLWWALVTMVMNLRFPYEAGNFSTG